MMSQNNRALRSNPNVDNNDGDLTLTVVSQNNRALRSNPNES